jgi:hypothetical protein
MSENVVQTNCILLPVFNCDAAGTFNQVFVTGIGGSVRMFEQPRQVLPPPEPNTDSHFYDYVLPAPRLTISVFPRNSEAAPWSALSKAADSHQLPLGFDEFDEWGVISGSTPGGLTAMCSGMSSHRKVAKAAFLVRADSSLSQELADAVLPLPIEWNAMVFAAGLSSALKLLSCGNVHLVKQYFSDQVNWADCFERYPLPELDGPRCTITAAAFGRLLQLASELCNIVRHDPTDIGLDEGVKVLGIGLKYYFLAHVQARDQARVFVFLTLVLEAVFKEEGEELTKGACRLAKSVATSKAEYKSLINFLGQSTKHGCCTWRNDILHGRAASPPRPLVSRFSEILSKGLIAIIRAVVVERAIDMTCFYASLDQWVHRRYAALARG